jgi:hypothetical protein
MPYASLPIRYTLNIILCVSVKPEILNNSLPKKRGGGKIKSNLQVSVYKPNVNKKNLLSSFGKTFVDIWARPHVMHSFYMSETQNKFKLYACILKRHCRVRSVCCVKWRFLRRADHSSRGVVPSVLCLSVIVKLR